jgi:ribosomal protein L40E
LQKGTAPSSTDADEEEEPRVMNRLGVLPAVLVGLFIMLLGLSILFRSWVGLQDFWPLVLVFAGMAFLIVGIYRRSHGKTMQRTPGSGALGTMFCWKCGTQLDSSMTYCWSCGAQRIMRRGVSKRLKEVAVQTIVCVNCGSQNPTTNLYCGRCGGALDATRAYEDHQ